MESDHDIGGANTATPRPMETEAEMAEEQTVEAGGYMVGERPAFLKHDTILAVVNNQKCTIYDCKQGKKIADCVEHVDMIVSCESFAYSDNIDILVTASSDGILKLFAVISYQDADDERGLIATFRISDGGLLSVLPSKSNGDLICVYSVGENNELAWLTVDYDALFNPELKFPVNEPIPIYLHEQNDGVEEVDKPLATTDDTINLSKKFVKSAQIICSLPSRIDVFAADADLACISFAVGKTAMVLNMKLRKILFFECLASVSCMTFYGENNFAVGDSKGRITLYNIDLTKDIQPNDNAVMACDLPDDIFELRPAQFKKVLLKYHSSVVTKERSDEGVFRNFRKVSASVNALIWHAHGVNCLTFNPDGTMLLSGGEEGVLVVWHLNTGAKKFLTRIGSAIFHVLCQKAHGSYILCCEANEILFVDPFALCIRHRITGITVHISIGMKVDKDVNHIKPTNDVNTEYLGCNVNDVSRANLALIGGYTPTVPLIEYWPTSISDSFSSEHHDTVVGGNVALYSRSSKLQMYNYLHDREVGSIMLKNVNILSRQDDDFGEDWELEALQISTDGRVVVTVQSRNVLTSPSDDEDLGLLPEFEHDSKRNNRKGLLKFWVQKRDDGTGDYEEQTKISNPHNHRTTSIRQLNNNYAFVTTSIDSEFKIWHVVRKRMIKSDDVFTACRTVDIGELDRDIDMNDTESFIWVCVTVGSYKNMPCFASTLTLSGGLLAISHDAVVTFWKTGNNYSSVELAGAMPFVDCADAKIEEDHVTMLSGHHMLEFLYHDQPKLMVYSKKSRLCIIDIGTGTTVWDYPLADGQVIDRAIYSPQLPNILVVATSTIDLGTNGCSGTLEMFWLDRVDGAISVDRFYEDHRGISRLVVNMCLTPAPLLRESAIVKSEKIEVASPAFKRNTRLSTLVLLTTNFNLETLIIQSDPFGRDRPMVNSKRKPAALPTRLKKTARVKPAVTYDPIGTFFESLMSSDVKRRKRVRHNLAENLCKSNEWQHRLKHPMPTSLLGAIVDAGCPTCALPSPNVLFNRLVQIVTCRHVTQG
ncbi:U3 small nucleolar RNA-associated protein 17 [Babesia sp. Xinjiang]|uniref:U3 small nucleolar RNA-associated protein 17 n=1 Tax=Babesia sp. Xinjiang TaxID=462227 RepID=UPI000A22E7C7|nr:U3 small nucleolar RNA-associated protein 17 [Babesia sp. Xinjiang]ORM39662.1 U3 small nucleolar RNA-associated protein 17 [Babesia sp. Xinjiang]